MLWRHEINHALKSRICGLGSNDGPDRQQQDGPVNPRDLQTESHNDDGQRDDDVNLGVPTAANGVSQTSECASKAVPQRSRSHGGLTADD